ncbi:MAG: GNAT family N-acetyltransferase [Candidatus Acidiferrales bacterium]
MPDDNARLRVRIAGVEDVDAIVRLVNLAFRVERFFIERDRTDAANTLKRFDSGTYLLGEDEARALVASVYVELRGERGYFGLLAVDPSKQRYGYGRFMVDQAEDYCRKAGCRVMDLTVVNLRAELPPYYRRLGYSESGEFPFAAEAVPKLPCHFIRMSKPLDESLDGFRSGRLPSH